MRVLESPITWIVVAAVLLVIALVLIVVSGVRRRRARRAAAAAAWPPPALEAGRADPEAAWTGPPGEAAPRNVTRKPVSNLGDSPDETSRADYADPSTDPLDVDAVRAGLAGDDRETSASGAAPDGGAEVPADDTAVTALTEATDVRADTAGDGDEAGTDAADGPATPSESAAVSPSASTPTAPATGPPPTPAADRPVAPLFRPYAVSLATAAAAPDTPDADQPPAAHRPRHAAADAEGPDGGADGTAVPPSPTPRASSPAAPADGATESAKDRLLAVLLRDPGAAVAALAAAEGGANGSGGAPGEKDVTALLRAGLSPAQVAGLVGVDEDRLATVVARGLGLLPGDQVPGGDPTTGENRTDDPGRSWANTASSAGSTTPTTG
ncbi:hypothetical protein Acsp06_22440 [Actinomycetospora sp. NBRC 106375]|uniref:hypothetical protein n=1 Tax=Actinomycetospora sp. NBRC 106375 TaxID=3032207 RepID=UPI0024A34C94|nr:hypothetical protein [Actinomycetospora sp. NBRC 106375]GLZ46059.1 hypothetical protein Acsp06_22440 [Actinomycetospora sp. NBRC 106375]